MMSLNPIPSILHYVDLQDRWRADAKRTRQITGQVISFELWTAFKNIDIDQEVQKPFDMLAYYQRVSSNTRKKYTNFKN